MYYVACFLKARADSLSPVLSPPSSSLSLSLSLSRFRFDASNLRPPRSSIPSTVSTLAVPEPVPPVADDCEQLQKAFAGWGTNEKLIMSILGHRNAAQRKLIRQTYAKTYGKDLLSASDRELTNDFERLVVLWTLDPAERDAYLVN